MAADFADAFRAVRGLEGLEIPDFAVPEDQHAPRLEIFIESGKRQAGFLHVGLLIWRASPSPPASSSRSRPNASGRLCSKPPTVMPAGVVVTVSISTISV
jgi:hypothetical protein